MKIQYCSDLHLEFPANENFLKRNPIVPTGEILILAGDIVLFSEMNNYSEFFDYLSKSFKAVYWVPGNHEYYHSDMKYRIGPFREEIRHNVFLLNDAVEIIDGVRFVFSTLWSFIGKDAEDEIWRSLNDFRLIMIDRKKFNTDIYSTLHREAKRFLSETLKQKYDGKTVVVTHHVPTILNYPPQYVGDALNMAFATELKSLIEETQPDCWIYGHHHANIPAFNIGKTTMLTNQMGYVYAKEHLKFDQAVVFLADPPKSGTLFMENKKRATELLAKQGPVIYEEMLEQARRVEQRMASVNRLHENFSKVKPKDKDLMTSKKSFNPNMTFQERARLASEILAKQGPVSFEEMRIQIQWLKENCPAKNKKQKNTGELMPLVQNKNVKTEIRNIISGESTVTNGIIQSAATYAGGKTAGDKKSERQRLEDYISGNDLWVNLEQIGPYLTEGVEQKVYRNDGNSVIKLNTSVYYSSWQSYLHNLLLNNYFFPETAYELIGFIRRNGELNAVVKQPFVKATEATDLELVKQFMDANGFVNTKNNDYRNDELGIKLEDLHEENVLTNEGILQFIDTVFYLTR